MNECLTPAQILIGYWVPNKWYTPEGDREQNDVQPLVC